MTHSEQWKKMKKKQIEKQREQHPHSIPRLPPF